MVNLGKESIKQFIESGAVLSTPRGTYLLGWGKNGSSAASPEATEFYVQDFFGEPKSIVFEHTYELSKSDLLKFLGAPTESQTEIKNGFNLDPTQKEIFKNHFILIKSEIKKNKIKKLVPYVFKKNDNQITPQEIIKYLINLVYNHHQFEDQYLYFFNQKSFGFCGITPEFLFYKNNNLIQTMALAGTQVIDSCEDEFLNNKKELSEHGFVVGYLEEKLSKLGRVTKQQLKTKEFRNIKHLYTPVEVELEQNYNYNNIVSLLHPTPALGGLPKETAVEHLRSINTDLHRGFFGAPFGVKFNAQVMCAVLIRGIFWNERDQRIYAGCGVVEQSILENEWEELNLKIESIEKNLGLLD